MLQPPRWQMQLSELINSRFRFKDRGPVGLIVGEGSFSPEFVVASLSRDFSCSGVFPSSRMRRKVREGTSTSGDVLGKLEPAVSSVGSATSSPVMREIVALM